MDDFTQFLWALWDASRVALVGLNPVPILIFGLFLGALLPRRVPVRLIAFIALVPAVIVTALLPMSMGYPAIWPDFGQMEVQIQMVMLLAVGYAAVRLAGLIRLTLSLARTQIKPAFGPKLTRQTPV